MNASQTSAEPSHPSPTLDADAVRRLRELDPEGKHGVLGRVMRTFETSLQRALVQLDDARRRHDVAAVGSLAHMLKSSSASVGALSLSTCCAAIERSARAGEVSDLSFCVDLMSAEAAQALVAVRALLQAEGL